MNTWVSILDVGAGAARIGEHQMGERAVIMRGEDQGFVDLRGPKDPDVPKEDPQGGDDAWLDG